MKELKCPKCGNVFTVDESDYADIVSQVKNAEELTIRKLTYKNPTMKAKFDEARDVVEELQ